MWGERQRGHATAPIRFSTVVNWDPEVRYKPVGTVKEPDAKSMIESTRALLEVL